jgi:hypothetical protein
MKMQVRLAATPNLSRSLAGGGNQSIGWNPGDLNNLIAQCRKQQTAARFSAGGLTQTRIVYSRPTG